MTIGGRTMRSTSLTRGDVVLVPFPYSELTTTKARPALIISTPTFLTEERRLTVAGIKSNVGAHVNRTSYVLPDWEGVGLRKPSVVTSWLCSIAPRIVLHRIGALGDADMRQVEARLQVALGV